MRFLNDPDVSWVVYEHATGTCWRVRPDTAENARREAALTGDGHEAMLLERARDLANAFAHGRMHGHEQARAQGQQTIDKHMRAVAQRVMDVFENADDDASADDVMSEVFAAVGLLESYGVR